MASFDKRPNGKWRAQVRRKGMGSVSRSFLKKKDAEKWARDTEAAIETGTYEKVTQAQPHLADPKATTLGKIIERYRDEVSAQKKGKRSEHYILNAFLNHPLVSKMLSEVTVQDWCRYRDDRLKDIKPVSLKRQLRIFQHMYEVAKEEWGFDIENPLTKVKLEYVDTRRDRMLQGDEWERITTEAKSRKNPLVLQVILWPRKRVCVGEKSSQ